MFVNWRCIRVIFNSQQSNTEDMEQGSACILMIFLFDGTDLISGYVFPLEKSLAKIFTG
jgi:hypothetical protein